MTTPSNAAITMMAIIVVLELSLAELAATSAEQTSAATQRMINSMTSNSGRVQVN